MPHEVIMPALGMAQDTGLLIAWHKQPGDAVKAGDILLEVETDKSTMEVEAGHDGFIAELRAEAGDDVPVGEVIAVIVVERPQTPMRRSLSQEPASAPPQAAVEPAETPSKEPAVPPKSRTSEEARLPAANGRILASPKARRLAAEEGLDLSRLVARGVAQPYHVADLETLRALPAETAGSTVGAAASMHLSARAPTAEFEAFRAWLVEEAARPVPVSAVLAAFAAGALRAGRDEPVGTLTIAVETPTAGRTLYHDADLAGFNNLDPAEDGAPMLLLRDLTGTRLADARLGAEAVPVLTLTRSGEELSIVLEAQPGALSADAAISLLSEFAARLETPLRQLL